jgi:hypothetical protein
MTLAFRHLALLARILVILVLVSVFALDRMLRLGLVHFLLHLSAWNYPT